MSEVQAAMERWKLVECPGSLATTYAKFTDPVLAFQRDQELIAADRVRLEPLIRELIAFRHDRERGVGDFCNVIDDIARGQ